MRPIQHPRLKQIALTVVMQALSDPVRLEIIYQLGNGLPKTCGELMGKRPKSSMSHHFKILRAAGLLETRIEGKEHYNALRIDELNRRFPGLLDSVLREISKGQMERSKRRSP